MATKRIRGLGLVASLLALLLLLLFPSLRTGFSSGELLPTYLAARPPPLRKLWSHSSLLSTSILHKSSSSFELLSPRRNFSPLISPTGSHLYLLGGLDTDRHTSIEGLDLVTGEKRYIKINNRSGRNLFASINHIDVLVAPRRSDDGSKWRAVVMTGLKGHRLSQTKDLERLLWVEFDEETPWEVDVLEGDSILHPRGAGGAAWVPLRVLEGDLVRRPGDGVNQIDFEVSRGVEEVACVVGGTSEGRAHNFYSETADILALEIPRGASASDVRALQRWEVIGHLPHRKAAQASVFIPPNLIISTGGIHRNNSKSDQDYHHWIDIEVCKIAPRTSSTSTRATCRLLVRHQLVTGKFGFAARAHVWDDGTGAMFVCSGAWKHGGSRRECEVFAVEELLQEWRELGGDT